MIEIILSRVQLEYDRERSNIDLKELKAIMKDIDYKKAAENIPLLAGSLFQSLTESDAQKLREEVERLLSLEEGERLKHITLGCILARYIGMNSLSNLVAEIKEYISIDEETTENKSKEGDSDDELNDLIKKYS
jgi:hypothetical protein